jgi:3-phosphoshikimate 1-carboxyvinyltransferase
MRSFGVDVVVESNSGRLAVLPQPYRAADFQVEPDASAASYFLAVAAICGGTVAIAGLGSDSIQGDVGFVGVLAEMGCLVSTTKQSIKVTGPALRGIDCDMRDISDTVQTLAAVSLFVECPTTIRGVSHIRGKETDRIGHLAIELRKLGANVIEFPDGMKIEPQQLRAAEIETYDDHRMAMSLSLVGLRQSGVVILNPDCVSKTYPNFFADLAKIVASTGD